MIKMAYFFDIPQELLENVDYKQSKDDLDATLLEGGDSADSEKDSTDSEDNSDYSQSDCEGNKIEEKSCI